MKGRKLKKKIGKRKKSDEMNLSENEEVKMETLETMYFSPQIEQRNCLDLFYGPFNIEGTKGHSNYYTNQSISSGTYYFEITIKSIDYNIIEYINQKRIDEFSKKYYENIILNPKHYYPNIRVGITHSTCDLEIPLGADQNSYCYRIRDGAIINDGEILGKNMECKQGDVIGILIKLKPPMPEFIRLKNENSDNLKTKNNECFVKYFTNGIEQRHEFRGLLEGNYHVVVTLYNHAQAEIDFGHNLKYFSNLNEPDAMPIKEANTKENN